MGSEWADSELGNLVRLQRGHDLTDSQRRPGNVPVMGSAGQNGFHDTSKARGPGIVLGRSGASFGKVHYTPDDYWPHNTALYVTDFQGNDELFTYYFLKTIDFTSYNTGSAQPSLNRNHLYSIPVNIPPLPEQKAIAHILGTLDDKIELNRRMNATLEGMAQALFKSWFVDFDPVIDNALAAGNPIPDELAPRAEVRKKALANGTTQQGSVDHPTLSDPKSLFPAAFQFTEELGWIPEGWNANRLDEICAVLDPHPSHRAPKEVTDGEPFAGIGDIDALGNINISKARKVSPADIEEQKNYYEIRSDSIGFGRVGTVGKVVRLRDQGYRYGLSPTLAVLNPRSDLHSEFAYFLVQSQRFQDSVHQFQSGSTRPSIGIKILRALQVAAPNNQKILEAFKSATCGGFAKVDRLNAESQTLIALRDTLLPKLISGELTIKN